jgi:hypothetical protein
MAILGNKNSTQFIRAFGLAEWLKERGLAGWLEIATDGLEAPAKQRIANEIGVHYAEAVYAHLMAGEPELSAQATALAELGDPQEAALNFKKSHLTESEAKSLKWMEWTAAKPFFSFWALALDGIPLAGIALLFSNVNRSFRLLQEYHIFAGFVLLGYAGGRLIPRLLIARTQPRNSFLKELALSNLITVLALATIVALIFYMRDREKFGAFDAVFIVYIYGSAFNPGFRIWNKLRKIVDAQHEVPPRQTTAT